MPSIEEVWSTIEDYENLVTNKNQRVWAILQKEDAKVSMLMMMVPFKWWVFTEDNLNLETEEREEKEPPPSPKYKPSRSRIKTQKRDNDMNNNENNEQPWRR